MSQPASATPPGDRGQSDSAAPARLPAEPRPAGQPGSIEPAPGEPRPSIVPPGLDATIVLIRHGESEWVARGLFQGQGDSPLSEMGRRQAVLAAERLAHAHRAPALPVPIGPPLAVVHSPLSRAAETAAVIADALSAAAAFDAPIPRLADSAFAEIGQGEWEGVAATTVADRWKDLLAQWRLDPLTAWAPGGESLPEVDDRVRMGLSRLLGRLADDRPAGAVERSQVLGYAELPSTEPWAILVGHDGSFKVALLALLDIPLSRFWSFPFALCGLTVVELRGGRVRLRLHNATDHLAPLETELARAKDAARSRSGAL
ncbi:MAG TPA: histidine phosphatase family protein [Candidatus Eisenbacteria bacterium]|nr:histidine phosphatase family protein [Candidatus Eisenbacteria bacterium]